MDEARSSVDVLAVAVGNTRTRVGLFRGKDLADPVSLPNDAIEPLVAAVLRALEGSHATPVVIATVNAPFADKLEVRLEEAVGDEVYRIGRDLRIPLTHTLDDAATVGQDRLLCALGAFKRAGQACVVIDAGTAVTVDFVDGEGVFHGGVIAPGVRMMLASLHERTAALPSLEPEAPDPARGPFGKDTRHAMLLGVRGAVQGLVHLMIDRYAEHYEAYPQIIATGGDAATLFEGDDLIEHIVPDLQLVGILETCLAELTGDDDADDPDAPRTVHDRDESPDADEDDGDD